MRVVGQQGGAAGGVGAGEGEAVAAGKGLGIAGLLGGEGGGRAGGRPGGGAGVPQVEDLFRRERGERGGGAVDGAIVGVRDLGEKRHAGDPELVPHRGQRQLVGSGRILQVEGHRIDDQDAVLRPPGRGRGAQHEVFKRLLAEVREAGVDAGGVGGEQLALGGREAREHLPRERPEPMHAGAPVQRQGRRAEQLGEFARPAPAQQVHLKEPVLGVQITQGPGDVGPRGAADEWHPQGIAGHGDRRPQPGQGHGPLQPRPAGAQLPVEPAPRARQQQQQHAEHAGEEAEPLAGG